MLIQLSINPTEAGRLFMEQMWTAVRGELLAKRELPGPLIAIRRPNGHVDQFALTIDRSSDLRMALAAACAASQRDELYALATQNWIWTRPTPPPVNMASMEPEVRERLGIVEGITLIVWEADGSGIPPQRSDTRIFQAVIGPDHTTGPVAELDLRGVAIHRKAEDLQ